MENKYKEGEFVYAKVIPTVKLMGRCPAGAIYYCKVQYEPAQKELVYFEWELTSDVKKKYRLQVIISFLL